MGKGKSPEDGGQRTEDGRDKGKYRTPNTEFRSIRIPRRINCLRCVTSLATSRN